MDVLHIFSDDALLSLFLLLIPVCLAASVYFLSSGHPGALMTGLWRSLVDLIVAPFAYLRHIVARLAAEGGASRRASPSDAQFLLRTQIRIQMAVLVLALSVFTAGGLIVAIYEGIPAEAAERRRNALARLETLQETTIPAIEKEIREVLAELNDQGSLRREFEEKKAALENMEKQMASLATQLELSPEGGAFRIIRQVLDENSRSLSSERAWSELQSSVRELLRRMTTPEDFDRQVLEYVELAQKRAATAAELPELDPAKRTAELKEAKENAELRLKESLQEEKELRKEASLERLFASYSFLLFFAALGGLLGLLWLLLWAGGLSIEFSELFIDIATNLRLLRMSSVRQVSPQMPVPTGAPDVPPVPPPGY